MGRKEGGKQNTKDFRLPVNTGVRSDTFAEDVPLLDINNYVLKADGSALKPREGYNIARSFASIGGSNRPRKTIFFIPDPPEIDGGDLIMISNWRDGQQAIENSEVVQAATIPPTNEGYVESIFTMGGNIWGGDMYETGSGVEVIIDRFGEIFGESSVKLRTINGTALAGVDYTAIDQTYTFVYGEQQKVFYITVLPAGSGTGKTLQVELYNPSEGSTAPASPPYGAFTNPATAKLEAPPL